MSGRFTKMSGHDFVRNVILNTDWRSYLFRDLEVMMVNHRYSKTIQRKNQIMLPYKTMLIRPILDYDVLDNLYHAKLCFQQMKFEKMKVTNMLQLCTSFE